MNATVTRSDVEKLGREVIEEVDNFLHDEWVINTFPKMKLEQQKFDQSINRDKSLDTAEMYDILNDINLDMEIDEDLYYKKITYEDLFRETFSRFMD